jgi:hypothetical protein
MFGNIWNRKLKYGWIKNYVINRKRKKKIK